MAEGGIGPTGSGSEINLIHSGLSLSQDQNENLSLEICSIMTKLGYGEAIRRRRVEKYKEFNRLITKGNDYFLLKTAGSKAEGLTCFLENDFDFLLVMKGAICVESGINIHTIPENIERFRMRTCVYPGYCTLIQEGTRVRNNCSEIIDPARCHNGFGYILLSSCLWVDNIKQGPLNWGITGKQHERAGPSIPATFREIAHTDFVVGLSCQCPSILHKWAARPREWPHPNIVQKVVSLGAYVTPVGFKKSEYNHMEWRICFNTGEAELVNSLNDTQAKVYVILKLILKEIIKPNNKEITSYVLKNSILWQAEKNPQTKFHARSLFYWLNDGLKELKTAIENRKLDYYMMPERNLMEGCGLTGALQRTWIADITKMMEEGPRVVLRLEKIRKAIVASPETMLWFSKNKVELEMLVLELFNRVMRCYNKFRNEGTQCYYGNWMMDWDVIMAIQRRIDELNRMDKQRMQLENSSSTQDIFVRILH
ncbi:hypothetical protein DPMN_159209 [Dreissena polymorpha]|uniref:Uncharacterized protein n=1 Tax=Dreissena polymorpha TaxID=45954 RepID=A0A9D4ENY8_DREPO|nr:hypothetical protein DPMN_159209 [Dreissena polymorpha]